MQRRSTRFKMAALCAASVTLVLGSPTVGRAVQTPHGVVVSANPADWTPDVLNGQVNAVLQVGTKVVVGGEFTQVRRHGFQQIFTRNNIFAFDMFTGVIDPSFVPQLNGRVEALALGPDGTSVFVGGAFNSTNGNTSYRRLVRLNLANGQQVVGFQPNPSAAVLDLVARGGWLYASGQFTTIGGQARGALARLNPTTGAVDPNLNLPFSGPQLGGGLSAREIDVTPDGTRLVAIGNFSQVAGQPRNQMAILDLSTMPASVSSWATSMTPFVDPNNPTQTWCANAFATWMRDMDIDPTGQYFVLVTTGAYRANRLCDSASRWEINATGPNQQPTWVDWSGGDTFWGVGITGTAIYVGGHQRWMNNPYRGDNPGAGAVAREGIAALDPVNGLPFSWNPGRDRGVGVFAFPASAEGLWVGSDTDVLAGEFHQKLGFFPVDGGAVVPPNDPYSLPGDLYDMNGTTGALTRRAYNGSVFGASSVVPTGVNWSTARGAFALNGVVYSGQSNGTLVSRTFNGTTMGAAQTVNLNGLDVAPPTNFLIPGTTTPVPAFSTHLATMTGMFFANGRIYYTVSGNPRLYYRYFTPESQVVGANLFVGSTTGVDWANVRGMTLASGNLYFALANGNLYRVAWQNGPSGAVTQIGGPAMDGRNWASVGLFVFQQSLDTIPPTKPGTPTGVSNTTDSIDLTWAASQDATQPLTYRVYRDGAPTAIAQFQSASTTTVTYHDGGLTPGSPHTYTVEAEDAGHLVSPRSDASAQITVLLPDTTPPTKPGKPVVSAFTSTSITLSWAPSTDTSTPITYRIFRAGVAAAVGQTTSTTFTDGGLQPGGTYSYTIQPEDAAHVPGPFSDPSDPFTTPTAFFTDDFSTGNFANWTTVAGLTIDGTQGSPAAPSALGQPTGQAAYAYRDLTAPQTSACFSLQVNASNVSGVPDLFRLRTAAGGPIARVYVAANGNLFIRSDFAGTQVNSGVGLGTGWHRIELCFTVGSSSALDLYRDGVPIVNDWVANTGTTAIGRVQIGDTAAKTWSARFDSAVLDGAPG